MKENKKKNKEFEIFFKEFSQRLSKARNDKQLSKSALAKMVGFSSPVQIFRYENGENFPDPFVLSKISKALDIDLHWLITGEIITQQNRIIAQFKETYSSLLKESQEAQDAVQRLEAKKQSGQPLTAAEERELLMCQGIERTVIRQMENAMQAASKELNTPGSDNNK